MNNRLKEDRIAQDKKLQEKAQQQLIDNNRPKTFCPICKQRTSPLPKECKCRPGGRATGGSSDEVTSNKANTIVSQHKPHHIPFAETKVVEMIDIDNNNQILWNGMRFNSEVISDLLKSNRLFINNDREHGTLTIQCNPTLIFDPAEKRELDKFIRSILDELEAFQNEKAIGSKCAHLKTTKPNMQGDFVSLRVTLPPEYYDQFILRLANKQLLPIENIEQQVNQKIAYPKEVDNLFNPLSMRSMPGQNKRRRDEMEDKHQWTPLKTRCKPDA